MGYLLRLVGIVVFVALFTGVTILIIDSVFVLFGTYSDVSVAAASIGGSTLALWVAIKHGML